MAKECWNPNKKGEKFCLQELLNFLENFTTLSMVSKLIQSDYPGHCSFCNVNLSGKYSYRISSLGETGL